MQMASEVPELIIRIGSHAEKEYLLKLAPFIDGVIVGANLFEAAPGATASLLLKIGGNNTKVFVDPMTYAFGQYTDPTTGKLRKDLDWIKSDQIRRDEQKRKKAVRDFKRSYRMLAEALGTPIAEAVRESRAIDTSDLSEPETRQRFCQTVLEYQENRIAREFENDEELRQFIENVPRPSAVFAPYFYVEPHRTEALLEMDLKLMATAADLRPSVPVHGVLCADASHLEQPELLKHLSDAIPRTGVTGIWLWFSRFHEESASEEALEGYVELITTLSKQMEVFAMHGGFFSLVLSRLGMQGISHGVGYGEQKNVVPVIGQSTPTVRYYLPSLARRLGVPEIFRAFHALNIRTPRDFHEKVCACAVCKGIVVSSLDEFAAFGDMHYSRPEAKRKGQTPAAAKRCRFHFLLSRLIERDSIRRSSIEDIIERLKLASGTWGNQPSLSTEHLDRWVKVLSP
jgi:hypothetical protein